MGKLNGIGIVDNLKQPPPPPPTQTLKTGLEITIGLDKLIQCSFQTRFLGKQCHSIMDPWRFCVHLVGEIKNKIFSFVHALAVIVLSDAPLL
jgi:hypothetical protein